MADKATCESDRVVPSAGGDSAFGQTEKVDGIDVVSAEKIESEISVSLPDPERSVPVVPAEKNEPAIPPLTDVSAPVEERSECPPPLAWSEVLLQVREQSEAFESTGRCGRFTGRKFGQGPSLYFLNGIAGNWELFVLTLWLLKDDFCCHVVDFPRERRRFSAEELAADLFQLADEQGDERFNLFATSYAVLPAFAAMIAQPQRICKAVIHAGFARRKLSLAERLLLGAGKVSPLSLRRTPFVQRIQRINHLRWFPPFDESRWQFYLENTGPVKVASVARWISALRKCDFRERLQRIDSPVLLLATEGEGSFAEKERDILQAGLQNARVEKLPHCGQLPFLTHPHILSKSLRTFLKDGMEIA